MCMSGDGDVLVRSGPPPYDHTCIIYSSFSQLGNSGNSAISVNSKGLTNAKIYLERKDSSKFKI